MLADVLDLDGKDLKFEGKLPFRAPAGRAKTLFVDTAAWVSKLFFAVFWGWGTALFKQNTTSGLRPAMSRCARRLGESPVITTGCRRVIIILPEQHPGLSTTLPCGAFANPHQAKNGQAEASKRGRCSPLFAHARPNFRVPVAMNAPNFRVPVVVKLQCLLFVCASRPRFRFQYALVSAVGLMQAPAPIFVLRFFRHLGQASQVKFRHGKHVFELFGL